MKIQLVFQIDFINPVTTSHSLAAVSHGMAMEKSKGLSQQLTCKNTHVPDEFPPCTQHAMMDVLIFSFHCRNSSSILVTIFLSQNLCWPALPAHTTIHKLQESWVASDYLLHFHLGSYPLYM